MPDKDANSNKNREWVSVIQDAADGSGDAIVPIPDELLEEMDWDEHTELEIEAVDGKIILREKGEDDLSPFDLRTAIAQRAVRACSYAVENAPKGVLTLKKGIKKTGEAISDAITGTLPYMRARDAWYKAQATHERTTQGYATEDAWNLGHTTLRHFAELLAVMSCESYSNAPDGWLEQLVEHSMVLNGYNAAASELELMWLSEGFHNKKGSKKIPKPVMTRIPQHLKDKLMESWTWIGENILSESFIRPDGYEAFFVPEEHSVYEDGYMSSYEADWLESSKPSDLVQRKAIRRLERKHSKTGVSRADIANAPYVELQRLSSLLYMMARRAYGHPEGYLSSDAQLQTRGEHWNEQQAISASLMGNPSVVKHDVTYRVDENSIGIKKNKDIGDYAAWIEDISDAASIFSKYACWLAPDGLKVALEAAQTPKSDITRLGKLHRNQFEQAWMWMGNLLETLWA